MGNLDDFGECDIISLGQMFERDNCMFNYDGGYIGRSRSVRSQQAIDSFEVPISLINRTLVEKFLDQYKDLYQFAELEILKKFLSQNGNILQK